MKSIAIIPARSGSKGLQDKNIRPLCGKPLMVYSIEAAKGSGFFDEILLSTDSEKYAEIAVKHGASVPFLRSAETSSDTASSWEVVIECLKNYRRMDREFDTVCLLQPTSPLRKAEDILTAYRLFEEKSADAVISVCESDHSPLWMNTLPESLSMEGFVTAGADAPRQELPTYYRINGAIYIRNVAALLSQQNIYKNCFAYIMNKERSIDIDTKFDFMLAECIMKEYSGKRG